MRSIIFILTVFISVSAGAGCKCKKESSTTVASSSAVAAGGTVGKVSHQYRSTGCETVIIIPAAGDAGEITLIPKDKLSTDMDVDGMMLSFDYHTLKMPQPAGCSVGMPAELTNISKMK